MRLSWGARLCVDPSEEIGATIWQYRVYDLAVTEALWRLLDPGDTAVDGGANVGYMSLVMASRVGPAGRVVSFEPHPLLFEKLQANLIRFRQDSPRTAPSFEPRPAALSRDQGAAHLMEPEDFSDNRGRSRLSERGQGHTVATESLDRVFGRDTVNVLKLDVEGHELAALEGASELLREGRIESIVFEAHEDERAALLAFFETLGYATFGLGRTFGGPLLSAAGGRPPVPAHEPPSFLATRAPADAQKRFEESGWRCLGHRAVTR